MPPTLLATCIAAGTRVPDQVVAFDRNPTRSQLLRTKSVGKRLDPPE